MRNANHALFRSLRSLWCLPAAVLLLAAASLAEEGGCTLYDPMAAPESGLVQKTDMALFDSERSREIPLRVYLPAVSDPAPVVLFSHGLGGSRENSAYLGEHWAARGYVAVFMQHLGSDESVWRDVPALERLPALREAANLENFMLRAQDVPVVLDQLEVWNAEAGHPLAGRMDLARVGMSGHSFGAVTTQAVSGQVFMRGRADSLTEPRIRAACAFSPSVPRFGDPEAAFGSVAIPWMLMTGTEDVAIIGHADVASRLAVYPALPPGEKYELVLFEAEHSAFSDRALPGDQHPRNPNHHRAIQALSTAFWDAYLKEDPAARGLA